MNDDQLLRYSRHILLDEWGIEAQEAVLSAHAIVIGAGGLGCPAALYLAAAGVGRLTLVDGDTVDQTNLQRQIAHGQTDVGRLKVASLADGIARINDSIRIDTIAQYADPALLDEWVPQASIVLDCTDHFTIRHQINAACVAHRRPLVSGAAIRFDGQISTFDLRQAEAACYACIFPEDAPPDEIACSTMGVFSPTVGIVGAMQAAEALKLIAGIGKTLSNRLMMLDSLRMEWNAFGIARQADCPVCAHRRQA